MAHGGGTYMWNNGATDSTISMIMDTSTSFKVRVTNGIGCSDSTLRHITVLHIPITGPIAGLINVNLLTNPIDTYIVPLHPGSIYNWTVSNGSIIGGTVMGGGFGSNQIIVQWYEHGTGTISVYETVDSGRCSTLPIFIPDTVTGSNVIVQNATADNLFNVYPNPANDGIWTDYAEPGCLEISISVTNAVGQRLYHCLYAGNETFHIHLENGLFPSPGIYTLQVKSENRIFTKKIVITK